MKQQFICERRPKADPRNIVLGKNYRITFLTDRLVRFEYNESGAFVDEASQVIWYRDLEEVPFEIALMMRWNSPVPSDSGTTANSTRESRNSTSFHSISQIKNTFGLLREGR